MDGCESGRKLRRVEFLCAERDYDSAIGLPRRLARRADPSTPFRTRIGSGTHALLQPFIVPGGSTVVLSFSLFVNSYGGNFVNPIGLDFTDGANQHARVDILTAGASALDTGAGVLRNFYLGTDSGGNPHAYASLSFDITSLVGGGGSFQLRFAEVDNQFFLNMGVDNVSIVATPAGVPEPVSLVQAALGFAVVGLLRCTRRRHKMDRSV